MKTFDHPGAEQVFNQLQAARKNKFCTQHEQLYTAAYRWWCHRRPVGWSEKEHLDNPVINLFNREVEGPLALAVAAMVADWRSK